MRPKIFHSMPFQEAAQASEGSGGQEAECAELPSGLDPGDVSSDYVLHSLGVLGVFLERIPEYATQT
jgi:hypothetical protein